MSDKVKNAALPLTMAAVLAGLLLFMLIKRPAVYSESERRPLQQAPQLSVQTVLNGTYMSELESYSLDQFPLRDTFRSMKAVCSEYVFWKKDNNALYMAGGHLSKLEYPVSYPMLDYAVERFDYLYEAYLKEQGITPFLVIVPDKNAYLAKPYGYLSLDYEELASYVCEKADYMVPIEIEELLTAEDYYRTDTHWKQECITDVAATIALALEADAFTEYTENVLEVPFYGVYYGQAALPVEPDTLTYLTSAAMADCIVTDYGTGKPQPAAIYDMEKAYGKDPYEMFLGGSTPLIVIENPHEDNGRHLIVFRDSFGSSLVPLLIEGYSRITVVDIRYVQSSVLSSFIDFEDAEVLFIYSTLLLNNSMGMT